MAVNVTKWRGTDYRLKYYIGKNSFGPPCVDVDKDDWKLRITELTGNQVYMENAC